MSLEWHALLHSSLALLVSAFISILVVKVHGIAASDTCADVTLCGTNFPLPDQFFMMSECYLIPLHRLDFDTMLSYC